jgi:chromosome partitioning protein
MTPTTEAAPTAATQEPQEKGSTRRPAIIAVANQKGGVGKTTTAVNLAACLAVAEKPTLLVDMDPQANATSGCGVQAADVEQGNIYHTLLGHLPIHDVVQLTKIPNLSIVPSHINLTGAEVEMVNMIAREQKLQNILSEVVQGYEYVILDCPPSLGLLTLNALTAADSVLIPIQCEYYALEGLGKLLNTIRLIQRHLNKKLQIAGVLLTMYDGRLNLSRQVADEVRSYFGSKVYKTAITRNVRLAEAPGHGQPIILYDIVSPGAQNYMSLAGEIIKHG